jgi:hypothetical protein
MKRFDGSRVLVLILVLGTFAIGAATAVAAPAHVAGIWNLAMRGRRGTFHQTLKLEQHGRSVTGTISGRMGETPVRGVVRGHKLSFAVTRHTARGTFTMEYHATVTGNSMRGTAGNERFHINFTGRRRGAM